MDSGSIVALKQFLTSIGFLCLTLIFLAYIRTKTALLMNKRVYATLGIVGVPVHELSHLIVAKLLGHKIVGVCLYNPGDPVNLGYVEHSYKPSLLSPIANLLIALAPLAGGLLVTIMVTYVLRPELLLVDFISLGSTGLMNEDLSNVYLKTELVFKLLLESPLSATQLALWFAVCYSLLMFSVPSRSDFSNCRAGWFVIGLIITIIAYFIPAVLGEISNLLRSLNWLWPLILSLHMIIFCLTLAIVSVFNMIRSVVFKRDQNKLPL